MMETNLPVLNTIDLEIPSEEEAMSISLCVEPISFSDLGEQQFKPSFVNKGFDVYMTAAELGEEVISTMILLSEAGCTSRKAVFDILKPLGYTVPKIELLLRKMRLLWESL